MSRQLVARIVFLALLAGGLLLWSQTRRPRDCALQIDLTQAQPGDVTEVDVVVRRSGHALARRDLTYGSQGAPGLVELTVHAAPGEAEVETTLVYAGKPAVRTVSAANLTVEAPARVLAK